MMRTRRRQSHRRASGDGFLATAAKGLFLAGLGAGAFFGVNYFKTNAHFAAVDERYCYVNAPTLARSLVMIDVTDPMVASQDRMVRGILDDVLSRLPTGGLLMTSSIDGEAPDQLEPLVETCKPAREDNRSRRYYEEEFVAEVYATIDRLGRQPEALASPILETLLAAANDPELKPDVGPVEIDMISDFMQYSSLANFYTGGARLPAPIGQPLTGLSIKMHVLRNDEFFYLQPAAADAFAAWLTEAGATVDYTPPTWMSVRSRPNIAELAYAN